MKNLKKNITFLLVALMATFFVQLNNTVSVQAVQVEQQYINNNRSYQSFRPQGIVIHCTDNEGATAQNNHDYFNREYAGANAHYFVDWNKAINTVPKTERGWHAGPTANRKYLGIEMCMPTRHNVEQFNSVYRNTVELAASLCKEYGWSASNIVSHYWVSHTWGETDHEDPIAYLGEYGTSFENLLNDIQKVIDGSTISISNSASNPQNSNIEKSKRFIGNRCLELQQSLSNWGYGLLEDGIYGQCTHNALGDFQSKHALEVDYLAGEKTFNALRSQNSVQTSNWISRLQQECNNQGYSNQNIDGIAGPNTLNGSPTLAYGNKGEITKILQEQLGISADGVFGSQTRQVVINYQSRHGLVADGVVGQNTWRVLLGF